MRIRTVFAFLISTSLLFSLLLTAAPVQAQTDPFYIEVNDLRDLVDLSPLDGICDAHESPGQQCTLRAAITTANKYTGDDSPVWILVPPGDYVINIPKTSNDSNANGDFDINPLKADIVIEGNDPFSPAFIDGNGVDRVFDVSGTRNISLYNLAITNGAIFNSTDYAEGGGGIRNFAPLTVDHVSIENNIVSCMPPTGCTGSVGGGIMNNGPLVISNSTIRNNYAYRGGAIFNTGGNSGIDIWNSALYENEAFAVGAINSFSPVVITNSTISGNRDTNSTGGIFMSSAELKMANVTLAGNRTSSSLGANLYTNFTVQVRNSIIADPGDDKANCQITPGPMISQGYNLSSDASCIFTAIGDQVNSDPRLSDLADWGGASRTRGLLFGSPAIDAGNPAGCRSFQDYELSADQRGQPRYPGRCDIGAFEGSLTQVFLPLVRH